MSTYPKDPFMLLSWTNMKLRDFYPSLDALCEDLEFARNELEETLKTAGFTYEETQNKFW